MTSMKKYLVPFWFALVSLYSTVAFTQSTAPDSVLKKFRQFRETSFEEKLFVHLDQDFYLTGEILWFRVFCVDATLHEVSSVSKVAYVEIIDKNNEALMQTK